MSNGVKKPITKKWWFWVIVVFLVFGIIGSLDKTKTNDESKTELTSTPAADNSATKQEETATDTKQEDTNEALKSALKDKEGLVWFGDVNNDVTGRWKLSEYASSDSLETFASEYYKAFFTSDDEIHAVINMTTKVTGKISKLGNNLDVTLYEYVDKEEHDAKILFGGTLLKEYWVNIETGEIEEIQ